MKTLKTCVSALTWLCGVPPNESATKRDRIQYIILTSLVITIHIMAAMSSAVFIYQNVSVDLEKTLYALYQHLANWQTFYQAVATVFLRDKLGEIIERLAEIYNENENSDSFHLLKQTYEKCECLCKMFIKYVLGGYCVSTITISTVSVLYSHFAYGKFEAEHAYHPYEFILPCNQSTMPGYSLEIGFGFVASIAYLISNGTLLILFISICLHHQTFYEMFRDEARKLDHHDKHRNDAAHLCKMIRLHNSTKDWFLDSAKVYSTFILIVLISNILYLACCIFELDLLVKHPDFQICMLLIAIAIGLSNLFAYCYCGKMATDSYMKMADCLYDCDWRELDPKYQKYIVIMIENAQRPIHYHGFGVAFLNLETFLKMIRVIYSYYMIFKTLTAN